MGEHVLSAVVDTFGLLLDGRDNSTGRFESNTSKRASPYAAKTAARAYCAAPTARPFDSFGDDEEEEVEHVYAFFQPRQRNIQRRGASGQESDDGMVMHMPSSCVNHYDAMSSEYDTMMHQGLVGRRTFLPSGKSGCVPPTRGGTYGRAPSRKITIDDAEPKPTVAPSAPSARDKSAYSGISTRSALASDNKMSGNSTKDTLAEDKSQCPLSLPQLQEMCNSALHGEQINLSEDQRNELLTWLSAKFALDQTEDNGEAFQAPSESVESKAGSSDEDTKYMFPVYDSSRPRVRYHDIRQVGPESFGNVGIADADRKLCRSGSPDKPKSTAGKVSPLVTLSVDRHFTGEVSTALGKCANTRQDKGKTPQTTYAAVKEVDSSFADSASSTTTNGAHEKVQRPKMQQLLSIEQNLDSTVPILLYRAKTSGYGASSSDASANNSKRVRTELEETLMNAVLKVDQIDSAGDDALRAERKRIVHKIEQLLDIVDEMKEREKAVTTEMASQDKVLLTKCADVEVAAAESPANAATVPERSVGQPPVAAHKAMENPDEVPAVDNVSISPVNCCSGPPESDAHFSTNSSTDISEKCDHDFEFVVAAGTSADSSRSSAEVLLTDVTAKEPKTPINIAVQQAVDIDKERELSEFLYAALQNDQKVTSNATGSQTGIDLPEKLTPHVRNASDEPGVRDTRRAALDVSSASLHESDLHEEPSQDSSKPQDLPKASEIAQSVVSSPYSADNSLRDYVEDADDDEAEELQNSSPSLDPSSSSLLVPNTDLKEQSDVDRHASNTETPAKKDASPPAPPVPKPAVVASTESTTNQNAVEEAAEIDGIASRHSDISDNASNSSSSSSWEAVTPIDSTSCVPSGDFPTRSTSTPPATSMLGNDATTTSDHSFSSEVEGEAQKKTKNNAKKRHGNASKKSRKTAERQAAKRNRKRSS